jgi:predicted ATPase
LIGVRAPYIAQIELRDFRCFDRVNVPLRPLTVLIGRNDSGKSSFLKGVIAAVQGPALQQDARMGTAIPFADGHLDEGRGSAAALRPAALFRLPTEGVPMTAHGIVDGAGAPPLEENGSGVAAVLDYLLRNDRQRFDSIVAELRKRVPGLDDLRVAVPDSAQARTINLALDHNLVLSAKEASTGVRLMIFFVTLLYHPNPPGVILLEEPENGVHPARLQEIVEMLRNVSTGEYGGRPAQVILSTHSPYLLDFITPELDQVLVFRRQDDGLRTVEPLDAERIRAFMGEFGLGEVWFNRGEEGLTARQE